MAAAPTSKVFISYSHRDTAYRDRLQEHLTPFVRSGRIPLWVDTQIRPGDDWHEEIRQGLADAQVAILLVSISFLASSFISNEELPNLLTAAEKRGLVILPVVVTPCNFEFTNLSRFQAVNDPSRPLSGLSQHGQDLIWEQVVKAVLERLKAPPAPKEAAPTSTGAPATPSISKALLTEQGDAHRKEGRYVDALDCYEQALVQDARYLRALRGRVWALKEQDLPDALDAAEETLALHPKDAETHYLKGLVLREMGREEDAVAALDEALKLYPRYEQAQAARARALEQVQAAVAPQQKKEPSAQAAPPPPKTQPTPAPDAQTQQEIQRLLAEGQAHIRAIRYHEALAAFESALAMDERNVDAWDGKGQALWALGRKAEALSAFERALVLDERDAAVWRWKGHALLALGRHAEALEAFERTLALDERDAAAWWGKGDALQRLGRAVESKQALQRWQELTRQGNEQPAPVASPPPKKQPTPAPDVLKQQEIQRLLAEGQAHYNARRYAEALAAYERALALDARAVVLWNNKGVALYNLGRYAEALAAYNRALVLNEWDADAWNGRGHSLSVLGRQAEGEQAFQRERVLRGRAGG